MAAKSKSSRRAGRNRRGTRSSVSDSRGSIGGGGIDVMGSTADSSPMHEGPPEAVMGGPTRLLTEAGNLGPFG